jgi:ribosome-binding factor A
MSRRLDRVNELLRREIGNVIQKDYEWHGKLVTVSEVEVTQDLKEGKVWTSVLGGDAGPVIDKLNREHGSIQSKVMKRVVLKSTPVLRFHSTPPPSAAWESSTCSKRWTSCRRPPKRIRSERNQTPRILRFAAPVLMRFRKPVARVWLQP